MQSLNFFQFFQFFFLHLYSFKNLTRYSVKLTVYQHTFYNISLNYSHVQQNNNQSMQCRQSINPIVHSLYNCSTISRCGLWCSGLLLVPNGESLGYWFGDTHGVHVNSTLTDATITDPEQAKVRKITC